MRFLGVGGAREPMRRGVGSPKRGYFLGVGVKATLSSWQGVCPKLLMMPSRAFLCVSSAMASRSTAPGDGDGHGGATWQAPPHFPAPRLTLVGAVVEDVEGLHGGRASLLVPENEVDPLVEVG